MLLTPKSVKPPFCLTVTVLYSVLYSVLHSVLHTCLVYNRVGALELLSEKRHQYKRRTHKPKTYKRRIVQTSDQYKRRTGTNILIPISLQPDDLNL